MRAFFAAVEQGLPVVRLADLAPALAPEDLAALRGAGVLRDEGRDGFEEVSAPDFARVLRALYGVKGRGLSVPSRFTRGATLLGWLREGDEEREVRLLTGPALSLDLELLGSRRALFLVPTARLVTAELRAKHGAGAYVEIGVLEEAVAVHDGHLARAGARAPTAPDLSSISSAPPPPPAIASSTSSASPLTSRLIPGAKLWGEIHISLVDTTIVRIDLPGVSVLRSCEDLGMAHAKNGRPRRAWELLVELCEGHGVFRSHRFGSADATKKLVSRLSAQLQEIFVLDGPAFHPYRPTEGWQAKFRASPRA